MTRGRVQKVVYKGTTGLQLQATVTERLLLQNYLLKYLEQTQSIMERGCASYWVLVIADRSILFPVLWLELFDVTVDLLVDRSNGCHDSSLFPHRFLTKTNISRGKY